MSNFNNNNKSACNSSSNPWNISSNNFTNIYASDWNISSKKWYSSLNTSKNIDEHCKHSSSEEDFVKIICTRPPISCHEPPIGQNMVIRKKIVTEKKYQIMIGKIVDNTIPFTINHNLGYRTTISSILMI